MNELSIYRVLITLEQGSQWGRSFVGQPTKKEILAAIERTRNEVLTQDHTETAYHQTMTNYADFQVLVTDHYMGIPGAIRCRYAGTNVGLISVECEDHLAFVTCDVVEELEAQ